MITVVILNSSEDTVIQLTYENLWKELKDIPGAQLLIADDWFDALNEAKNTYLCFVESDCLVSSGYFTSQVNLINKNKMLRKLAMLASRTGVTHWGNAFYGYHINSSLKTPLVQPVRERRSTSNLYPIQIGFFPGSIIRRKMLLEALQTIDLPKDYQKDLVYLSVLLCVAFWNQSDGNRVHINPNTTYVTTESYVNDVSNFTNALGNASKIFEKESI